MKYIFIAICVMATSFIAVGQVSSVSYECSLSLKSGNPENGLNKLYIAGLESLYVFEEWPEKDEWGGSGTVVSYVLGDEEGMPVYTNLSTKEQVYKTGFHAPKSRPWILTEPMPVIDWKITDSTRYFGNLAAFFATGVYGGRDYEVWFTPSIPVPLGPHRLNGLPGLILEAKSTDEKVSFTFVEYQSVDSTKTEVGPPQIGNVIERRMLEKFLIQKMLRREAKSPPEWNDTIDDPPLDYEIERKKWTVFSDYKRKRLREKGGG